MSKKAGWGALGSVNRITMLTQNRANWIENKAIPDSISMNMTRRSVFPPVKALTSRNTLKILKTINPVTRAFIIIDSVRPVRVRILLQAECVWPSTTANTGRVACAIQIARNYRLKSVSDQ